MTMESNLNERFGPLIPLSGIATLLNRSPEATRMFLRSNCAFAERINASKLKIGRRLFFRTADIAQALSEK